MQNTIAKLVFSAASLTVFCFSVLAKQTEADISGAELNILIANPKQCVAMNKGQVCYQDVVLQWRSVATGDFCVRSSQATEPLACWQGQRNGELALSVEATESVLFTLNDQPTDTKLAEAMMRVAWVYKQSRSKITSWRLF